MCCPVAGRLPSRLVASSSSLTNISSNILASTYQKDPTQLVIEQLAVNLLSANMILRIKMGVVEYSYMCVKIDLV